MVFLFRWSWRYVLVATLECPENPLLLLPWWFSLFAEKKEENRQKITTIGFRAWGYPSHAYFSSHAN